MGPYRCEALTSTGRRCKCQAVLCVPTAKGEFLACKQHATATFKPAVKVSACPPSPY